MLGAYNWKISRGDEAETLLQGYVRPQYAKPGSTISFHASSEIDGCQFFIRIFRLGWYGGSGARQVHRSKIITVDSNGVWSKENGWQGNSKLGDAVLGMNWPRAYQLYIPDDWLSGSYIARFETLDGKAYIHPFWVSTTGESTAKIAVLGAVITSQARNWWGGISATKVLKGAPDVKEHLYYPVGSEKLSFERPYFNPRGGDALRWEYPLVRWLEKMGIEVAYHTDLELETNPEILERYTHIITAGPMRYWTVNTESALVNYVNSGGNVVHLGSEAGQHIVALRNHNDYRDGQIILQPDEEYKDIGERLENRFFSSTISGSRNKAPWANLKINSKMNKYMPSQLKLPALEIEGIVGLSWDKSMPSDDVEIVANKRIKHRKWTYRNANSHIKKFPSGGSIFNAGVSSWTWGLEKFGNHGNAEMDENLQSITLGLFGISRDDLPKSTQIANMSKEGYRDSVGLEEYNALLLANPRDFDALMGAGLILFQEKEYYQAHTYFERAIQVRPSSIIANYRLARNHHKLKQFEEMVPIYDFLIENCPHRLHYRIQYSQLCVNLKRYKEAEETILEVIQELPEDPRGWTILALCYRRTERFQQAEEYCQKALILEPDNLDSLIQHALISQDADGYLEAESRWEKVAKKAPDNYLSMLGIAKASFKKKEFEKGKKILEGLIQTEENKSKILPYLELIYLNFNEYKDYSETVKICNLLLENIGTKMQEHKRLEHIIYCHLAISLLKIERIEEAITTVEKLLLENPENDEYRLCLSKIYRESGDYEKSFEYLNEIFALSKKDVSPISSKGESMEISVEFLTKTDSSKEYDGPLVSVIMTTYKSLELLEIAVNSILNQTHQNLELIIVDDKSPDNTFDLIMELSKKDSRIIPLRMKENGGTYKAKNYGIQRAKGKYIAFHDSDDWCHQDKVKLQVARLESKPNLVGVTTSYIRVDENSNIVYRGVGAIRHACISLMYRRKLVEEKIGFFDSVRVSADSEFERRIFAVFGESAISHINLPMIIASVRQESLSGGGKFAINWTGLTGPRFEYRKKFEHYHNQIQQGVKSGFIPFPHDKREFEAPEEMIW